MTQVCPHLKVLYDTVTEEWVVKCTGTDETCLRKRGKAPKYPVSRTCWQIKRGEE